MGILVVHRNAGFLTYKKNGLAFGLTHIHGYTEKKVYAIDYRLVEGISRKIVRLPQSGEICDVEIELNEFQVQMAIDHLQTFKLGEKLVENISVEQKEDSVIV